VDKCPLINDNSVKPIKIGWLVAN